jgi:hypothetical protein
MHDKRVAAILRLSSKSLGWEYGRAPFWLTHPLCERQCRVLQQHHSAAPPFDITGNPEVILVVANEQCWDRLASRNAQAAKIAGVVVDSCWRKLKTVLANAGKLISISRQVAASEAEARH